MFKQQRRPLVEHAGEAADLFQDDPLQRVRVGDGQVDDEVLGPGDEIDADGLRQLKDPVGEGPDDVIVFRPQPHKDQRLQATTHRRQVDVAVVTGEDTPLLKVSDPGQRRGRSEPRGRGQRTVCLTGIALQLADQHQICRVNNGVTHGGIRSVPEESEGLKPNDSP